MRRSIVLLSLALSALPLSACIEDGYGFGGIYLAGDYPYSGYYDDYYGPIYDGYWGSNGYFYYRHSENDRNYRRGDKDHFRRDGDSSNERFHPIQGNTRPQQGARMPHFGGAARNGGDHGPNRSRR